MAKINFIFCFGITLFLLSLIPRYPSNSYEYGADAIETHAMLKSLLFFGEANWIRGFLGYSGNLPLSYASGLHFYSGSIILLTDINSTSFVFMNTFINLVFMSMVILIFLLKYNRDLITNFLIVFLIITSPLVILQTNYILSTRSFSLPFIMLFVYFLRTFFYKFDIRDFFLLLTFAFIAFHIHNLSFLLLIFLLAFVICVLEKKVLKYFSLPEYIRRSNYTIMAFSIIIILAQCMRLGYYQDFQIWYDATTSRFFSGTSAHNIFLGAISDYVSKLGLLVIPPTFVTISYLSKTSIRYSENRFYFIIIFLIVPFMTMTEYMSWIIIIPIMILISDFKPKFNLWVVLFVLTNLILSVVYINGQYDKEVDSQVAYGSVSYIELEARDTSLYISSFTNNNTFATQTFAERLIVFDGNTIIGNSKLHLSSLEYLDDYRIDDNPIIFDSSSNNLMIFDEPFNYELSIFDEDLYAAQYRYITDYRTERFYSIFEIKYVILNVNSDLESMEKYHDNHYKIYTNNNVELVCL